MLRPDNLDTVCRKNTEVVATAVEVTAEMTEFLHRVVATEGATVVVRERKATVAVVAIRSIFAPFETTAPHRKSSKYITI